MSWSGRPKTCASLERGKTIDLVYFNAGGGHRAAATALETVIREQGRPWQVRLVNLMKILDPKDVFRKTTGMEWEDIYNTRLARGWSVGLAQELKLLQALIRFSRRSMAPAAEAALAQDQARHGGLAHTEFQSHDVRRARRRPARQAPYVTILTDFADYPPHFWIEPGSGAALHLRHAEGGGPGARDGLCG